MKRNRHILGNAIIILLVIAGTGILKGCRTQELIKKQGIEKNENEIYAGNAIKSYRIEKIRGEIENEEKKDKFIAHIAGKAGNGLMASVRSGIGIEIIRIWWIGDSIYILNRAEKNYMIVESERMINTCTVLKDIDAIHSIILGKYFNYIKNEIMNNDEGDGEGNKINYLKNEYKIGITYDRNRLIDREIIINCGIQKAEIRIRSEKKYEGIWLPEEIEINQGRSKKQKMRLIFDKIEINPDIRIDVKIPDGYKRIYHE